jgi:signal-transduction protein with cAMP-binding, CBS, and nucleotidyltransferase domain
MEAQIKLGRIFGVQVGLHYSWLIIALQVMGREDLNQLPVGRNGQFEGIISRSHILRLLQTRAELRA